MKTNRTNPFLIAAITVTGIAFTATSAFAASLYWDSNGTTPGAGTTPAGIWGTSTFWTTDSTGASATANTLTTSVDDLFFSAGTDATGSYNPTLAVSQTARKLTFEDGTATIGTVGGGNILTLAGGGGLTVDSTTTGATASVALILNGHNTFNVGSGSTLTVNGTAFTRGTRASLNVQGAGTVAAPAALGTALSGATIAPWASIGTGTSTSYATISAGNITGLGYTGGLDGTTVPDASGVTDTGGTLDYDIAAVGTLGAGASVNTLRYTGATGNILGDLATKGLMNASGVNLSFAGAVTAGATANELVIHTVNGPMGLNGIVTGAINKTGSDTLILSGTPVHALGVWTVNQGTLILNSANVPVTNAEVIPGGTINSGGTAKLGTGNRVANGAIFTINAGGTLDLNGQGDLVGGFSGAGSVITTGTPTFALGSAGTLTFSGVISGGVKLIKRNGGDQILTGANTFTGTTSVFNTNATLTLGNSLALQNSALDTAITIAGNGTTGLRTTVTTLTLGGLSGNKDLASLFRADATGGPGGTTALGGYSGVTALTLNPLSGTQTYSAIIADGAAGMTLAKTGAGTQVLSGVNTYSGATAVNNGTLLVNSPGSLASTSAVTVAAGAALGGNGAINGTVNASAGGLLAPGGAGTIGTLTLADNSASSLTLNGNALLFDLPNTGSTSDLIAITGGLVLNGANYLALTAPSGLVPEGTYTLMTYSAQTGSGTLTFQNGTTTFGNATLTVGATSVTLSVGVGGLNLGLDTWVGGVSGSAGVWDGGILNWKQNGTASSAYADGDAVMFDDSATTTATISSAAPVNPASVLFNNTTKNYTVSAVIAGATTLAKTGSGATTLTGATTFTGATTISGGTLKLSGGGRLGNGNYAGAMSIAPGATFEHAGGTQTLSGAITGGGSVVLGGESGGLILSGSGNSYGSLTMTSIVTGGRVFIGNTGALPAAATVAINGGTFVINAAGTYNSPITAASGVGITARIAATLTNVTLPGSGSVIFNNDDADTNLLTISTDQTLTGALTVQVGGNKMSPTTAALGAATLSGKLTGNGSLVVTSGGNIDNTTLFGTGVLTLTGPNDYTGDTTVNSGVLAVDGDSLPDAGKLVINGAGKVNLTNIESVSALDFDGTPQPSGDYSATGVPVGASVTIASFTGSGTLTVGVAPANNYVSWAASQVPPVTEGPNGDDDKDGVKNLVEYALADGQERGTLTGTSISFAKRGGVYGGDITYEIESSDNLGISDPWSPVTPTVDTTSTISYTLPNPGDNFARLKVVQVP